MEVSLANQLEVCSFPSRVLSIEQVTFIIIINDIIIIITIIILIRLCRWWRWLLNFIRHPPLQGATYHRATYTL